MTATRTSALHRGWGLGGLSIRVSCVNGVEGNMQRRYEIAQRRCACPSPPAPTCDEPSVSARAVSGALRACRARVWGNPNYSSSSDDH